MVFQDGFCNVSLVLSLGNSSQENGKQPWKMANKPSLDRQGLVFPSFHLEPDLSLTLLKSHSKDEEVTNPPKKTDTDMAYGDCAPSCIKRERDSISEDLETERVSSRISTDEDDEGHSKKRLRLTKDQSSFLEDSFKKHSTLNPKQKQALAKQLNLRSRQVEVWFQNRRARTKLKLTEMDREMLKRCCETLRDENRRLHKELQELKALKFTSPLSMQVPAATLTMCPSCERIFTKDKTTKAPPCET